MGRRMIRMFCALVVCFMALTAIPATASAGSLWTHNVYYNLNGGWTLKQIQPHGYVLDNSTLQIRSNQPHKEGYRFDGYHLYRMSDKKWFVSGKGWQKSEKGAKLYKPNQRLKLDSSWTKGCKKSHYKFYAQWTRIHDVCLCKSNWTTYQHYQIANNGILQISYYLKKSGKRNIGWYLCREDRSGQKWYVAGKGWLTQSTINKCKYKKKLYYNNTPYKLDSSWTNGSNGWASYYFLPVYQ